MSSGPTYDEKLLLQAPRIAKAEAREGYDVDILGSEMQGARSASNHDAAFPPAPGIHGAFAADEAQHAKPPRPSFWRSTRGKMLIALIVILVLAAAIGGGVGGALGNRSKSTTGHGITGSDGPSGSDTNQGTSSQSSSDGSGQS